MSNVAIRVEALGKRYRIGARQEKYRTLRDTIADTVIAPFVKTRALLRGQSAAGLRQDVWALRDVSFQVEHGEVVGIIGHNGAGKSTLLKILSRITEPTTGSADLYGRVGALLEVGTGFHPELTGRENVFLNGAILGMSRQDIQRKFDQIVEFAGVETFIDTPVKHYSSGMGLRLGFSVAAHLEPEILIVDEVLAVGDAEFQRKCLGKMSDVAGEGRTVLFVSHNMGAISRIARRCIWIKDGSIVDQDVTDVIVSRYLRESNGTTHEGKTLFVGEKNDTILLQAVQVLDETAAPLERPLFFGEPFQLLTTWRAKKPLENISVFARIETSDGSILATLNSRDNHLQFTLAEGDSIQVAWRTASNPLVPGTYYLSFAIHNNNWHPLDNFRHVVEFQVSEVRGPERFSRHSSSAGYVFITGEWQLAEAELAGE